MNQENHSAPLPIDEIDRLAELRRYSILDTPPEVAFDIITQLAAHICETPIALISLVDGDRQWFKARCGLDVNETPRDVAFCSHAILHNGLFVVPDATRDDRFAQNPLVTGPPNIRFYAGFPLKSPHAHNLGTLCVLDYIPRAEFSQKQRDLMTGLASFVLDALELRLKTDQLVDEADKLQKAQKENDQMQKQLEKAHYQLYRAEAHHDVAATLNLFQENPIYGFAPSR